MNQELANVLKLYTTKPHKELNGYLIGKSKDNLIAILMDLITMYVNDKNSSTIREFITVTLAGYEHREEKIGYNGFKQDSFTPGRTLKCEAKPKNCDTNAKSIAKLRGAGNFSDYTFARLKKDMEEPGLNILVSGFIDGKLIYILEFPFSFSGFVTNLKRQLLRKYPNGKDVLSDYLRSAEFSYKDYIDCRQLRFVYILEKSSLQEVKQYLVKVFYSFLEANAK
jgi:hypothetical protein